MENPWGEEPEWAKEGTEVDELLCPDDDDNDFPWFGAQHILILIDCSSTMFKPCIEWTDNQRLSPMDASILACERLLRSRVLHVATQKTGKRDGIGVILFGGRTYDSYLEHDDADDDQITEQKSPTQILVDLNPPGVKEIQMLRSCLKDPVRGRSRDLRAEFQNNNYVDQARHLRIALQLANKVFSEAKCVKSSRTLNSKVPRDLKSIWIFTNQDNPHQSQDEEKHQIHQIMTDIIDGGVEFAVWPLPKGNEVENFDPSLLYCHLPCHVMSRPIFDFMDMLETIACQSKKPRRVFRLPILFPDWKSRKEDPGIMVDFYNLIQEQKKPQLKWINQRTKQPTERVTQTIVKETGEVIRANGATDDTLDLNRAANRILQYTTFGTERVYLSNDDVAAIKRSSQPEIGKACLILLGFKPISSIPIHLILDKAYFIYPTEEGAEGSTEAFAYLHASMRSKNVVGIGELLTHTTSTSRMVAIFPQDERKEVSENGFEEQILPPGMIIVKLPFEDDLRALEEDENVPAGDELIEKAMDLIQHQMLDDVEIGVNFENKALHKFWSYIESVALDFPVPAEETYEMDLNEIEIWKAAGPQIESFRGLLPLEESIKSEVKPSSAVPQKRKKPEVPEDKSGIDWMHLFQTNSLPSSKVEDLKSFLKSRGSRCGGRKADLISRVSQIISEQINQENSSKIYNS